MEAKARAVVALGTFDGMHKGHTALIRRTVERAGEENAVSAVFTFANHPLEVLGKAPRLLSNLDERIAMIRALGIGEIVAEPFTRAFAGISPAAFLELLMKRWEIVSLVCGFNYTYGCRGAGTPETLKQAGSARGFGVEVLPPVMAGGEAVSSSAIRRAIEEGDMAKANAMLDRTYTLSGEVVSNLQNGRRIGFPTANIRWDDRLVLPKCGVYRTRAAAMGRTFPAVTNVGQNPTLHAQYKTLETHLIGFSGDLYGETLAVSFLEYLRGDIAFDSIEALKAQIASDVACVLKAEENGQNGK